MQVVRIYDFISETDCYGAVSLPGHFLFSQDNICRVVHKLAIKRRYDFYRLLMKLREDSVFSRVCHSVQVGVHGQDHCTGPCSQQVQLGPHRTRKLYTRHV